MHDHTNKHLNDALRIPRYPKVTSGQKLHFRKMKIEICTHSQMQIGNMKGRYEINKLWNLSVRESDYMEQ